MATRSPGPTRSSEWKAPRTSTGCTLGEETLQLGHAISWLITTTGTSAQKIIMHNPMARRPGRERGRDRGRERGGEEEREGGRQGWREGGGMEGGREEGRDGGREGRMCEGMRQLCT